MPPIFLTSPSNTKYNLSFWRRNFILS